MNDPGKSPTSIFDSGPADAVGAPTWFSRNEEIFCEGERAQYLYKVKSGCIRAYQMHDDGRRQIYAFYLPGDTFGLEARGEHFVSAEAVTRCKVHIIEKTMLMARAAMDKELLSHLLDLTTLELQRAQRHILNGLKTAQERVVGFLLEMQRRQNNCREINLPMSRQDIADYIGLSIETVSRVLTRLEGASAISLPSSRCAILHKPRAFDRLNS